MTRTVFSPAGGWCSAASSSSTRRASTATPTPTCSRTPSTDALLGAAGLGDIGEHFPDSDERWRDADSMRLLAHVYGLLDAERLELVNVDCTIAMERPKLGARKLEIRDSLAATLQLDRRRVNVKASTGEGIGFVGRGEGVAALAVASLRER